jgi:hypothetical protein
VISHRRCLAVSARTSLFAALVAAVPVLALAPAPLVAHATTTATSSVLVDGNFEATEPQSFWTEGQAANTPRYPLIDTYKPNRNVSSSSQQSADFCDDDNCQDQLIQVFTNPSQVTQATLTYWYAIATTESNGNSACHDHLYVGLGQNNWLDSSANQLLCAATPYTSTSLDVTSYLQARGGQPVDVILAGVTDNMWKSEFFVDDITLTVTYLNTPSAPLNVTASSGAANSATVDWQAPAYPLNSTPTGYTITPYVQGVAQNNLAATTAGSATSYTFSNLTNATTYSFSVTATNASGTGPGASSFSVTPQSSAPPATRMSAVSSPSSQYQLPNSDGVTWQDIDTNNLTLSFTPATTGEAIITGNSDLWTSTSGFNQDIGLSVNGATVAWKESGGTATFAPNAALVQGVVAVQAGTAYAVRLQWKTNQPAMGVTIWAGAGGAGAYSPTRLGVQLVNSFGSSAPYANGRSVSTSPAAQPTLGGSNGQWTPVDPSLQMSVQPGSAGQLVISGNADLWTFAAGINQDIGLQVNNTVIAWKESGGAATFSPNAAYVLGTFAVPAQSSPISVQLVWKANRPTGATIVAGAGSTGAFSPTSLTAVFFAAGSASTAQTAATATQYTLGGSDGSTWRRLDSGSGASGATTLTLTTPDDGVTHSWNVVANADLWTASVGYNQDLGICMNQGTGIGATCAAGATLVGWKESGGRLAAFAPNAALLQAGAQLLSNTTYTFTIVWKTNTSAPGATIYDAAGSPGSFSTTTLLVQLAS